MQTVLKIFTNDGQGVMDRLLGVVRRFGCNIGSIAAGEVEEGIYDISISFRTMGVDIESLGNRLSSLDFVRGWEQYNLETGYLREMVLGTTTKKVWDTLDIDQLSLTEQVDEQIFFEYTGTPDQAGEMMHQLRQHDIICTRSGPTCLGFFPKEDA